MRVNPVDTVCVADGVTVLVRVADCDCEQMEINSDDEVHVQVNTPSLQTCEVGEGVCVEVCDCEGELLLVCVRDWLRVTDGVRNCDGV